MSGLVMALNLFLIILFVKLQELLALSLIGINFK